MPQKYAKLQIDDQTFNYPILESSRGVNAIDISTLLKDTGLITLDQGYVNTGSCTSAITYLDGKNVSSHRTALIFLTPWPGSW